MCSIALIILHTAVAQVHATELASNDTMDKLANKLVDELFGQVHDPKDRLIDKVATSLDDMLFGRAHEVLNASPVHHAGLDDTTLAKAHLAKSSSSSLYARPLLPVLHTPLTISRSSLSVPSPLSDFAPPGAKQQPQFHMVSPVYANRMKKEVEQPSSFAKQLEIRGTGYRAAMDGEDMILNVGFSHEVKLSPWKDTKLKVTNKQGTELEVTGPDKADVGEMAARIRRVRPPEPYGGKGVRYVGEVVRMKPIKQGTAR
eukprot:gnl/MRDRNA2_/MRDRNA2_150459_c0_seq1.p1 gnl/MRDRNA2_/MRDRNA2_150459_c0~~gnl/MRDRNA2_/MRDRNA2_150459_c0_seq1.p1  ORF type:complete len:258 (+),score=49.21 gnl/MRDRNA2_/MRDRNA2_150459_c0_seq1:116-889(+)